MLEELVTDNGSQRRPELHRRQSFLVERLHLKVFNCHQARLPLGSHLDECRLGVDNLYLLFNSCETDTAQSVKRTLAIAGARLPVVHDASLRI